MSVRGEGGGLMSRVDKAIIEIEKKRQALALSLPQLAQLNVVMDALGKGENPAIEIAVDNSSHNRDRMQREEHNQRHNLCIRRSQGRYTVSALFGQTRASE